MSGVLLTVVSAAVLGIAMPEGVASADRRIAVLEIEGARTPRLRKDVTRAIEPNQSMSAQAYRNASKRLRAVKLTPNNVSKVSRYLEVDGVIDGTLVSERGLYKLVIRVRSGRTGLIQKRVAMRLNEPKLSSELKSGLRKRLLAAIDDLPELEGGDSFEDEGAVAGAGEEGFIEDEEAKPRRSKRRRPRRVASRDRRSKRDRDRADVDEEEFEEDFEDDEGEFEDDFEETASRDDEEDWDDDWEDEEEFGGSVERARKDSRGGVNPREFQVKMFAGFGASKRKLKFRYSPDLMGDAPLGYKGAMVPTGFVQAEVYPVKEGGLKNVGLTASYDRVLKISSGVENPMTGEQEILPTKQEKYRIGALYRLNFGDGVKSPSLIFSVGWTRLDFKINKAAASDGVIVDIPNVTYAYVDPGAQFRFGVTDEAAFFAEGRGILMVRTGPIQGPNEYGSAKVTGVDGDGGLEYIVSQKYLLRAGARVTYIAFDFNDNGNLTDRDGDGQTDVGGAADRFLGGYGSFGFLF